MSIAIGCDPEVFLERMGDKKHTPIPVCGLIGGTKEKPLALDAEYKPGYAVQEDGAALELNTPSFPEGSSFRTGLYHYMAWLKGYLGKKKLAILGDKQSVDLAPDWFQMYPQLNTLGCEPDWCAYAADAPRPTPNIKELGTARHGAGHIHLSYDREACPPHIMAKFMDLFMTAPTLGVDPQPGRKKFYGLAGLYRPKAYGLEYRTPSNKWLFSLERDWTNYYLHMPVVLAQTLRDSPDLLKTIYKTTNWGALREAINTGDIETAKPLTENAAVAIGGAMWKYYRYLNNAVTSI